MDLSSRKRTGAFIPRQGSLSGTFGTWLISEADTRDDPKRLISLAGQIRPLIRNRIDQELRKSLREITEELSNVFYDASHGRTRASEDSVEGVPGSHVIWEFPISNKPITVNGKILRLGTVAVAYEFPVESKVTASELKPEEREKFLRERAKFFLDFLKGSLLKGDTIDRIADDLTYKFYNGEPGKVTPTLLWVGKITADNGKRMMGRVVVAHRLLGSKEPEV